MDAGAVRERAVELVDALNALGWHADPGFEPVSIGGVIGDDALVAVGIRWHAQHDLGGGPSRPSARFNSPTIPTRRLHEQVARPVDLEHGLGTGVLERPLERTDEGPAGFRLVRPGVNREYNPAQTGSFRVTQCQGPEPRKCLMR
jgi:hypothetical protein